MKTEPWKYYARKGRTAANEYAAPDVTSDSPQVAYEQVLRTAGCFPRDVVTRRIVREVQEGTGKWGRPGPEELMQDLQPTQPPVDTDADGMPDAWEKTHGLNPNDGSDHQLVVDSGYTAIEQYCHELAIAILSNQTTR